MGHSTFTSAPYETRYEELKEALAWLEQLGIRCSSTRLGHFKRIIEEIVKYRKRGDFPKKYSISDLMISIYEIDEIIKIYSGLHKVLSPQKIKRYKNLKNGPFSLAEENLNTNDGRNITFELVLISYFVLAGFKINLDSLSDIHFIHDNYEIFVECKRPQNFSAIKDNLQDACNQLSRRCTAENSRGIVAISIGKLITQGQKILEGPTSRQVGDALTQECERFVKAYLNSPIIKGHKKIIGILGFLGTSGMILETNTPTSLMQLSIGCPIHVNSNDKILLNSIASKF